LGASARFTKPRDRIVETGPADQQDGAHEDEKPEIVGDEAIRTRSAHPVDERAEKGEHGEFDNRGQQRHAQRHCDQAFDRPQEIAQETDQIARRLFDRQRLQRVEPPLQSRERKGATQSRCCQTRSNPDSWPDPACVRDREEAAAI
jgi:hypothetical protein